MHDDFGSRLSMLRRLRLWYVAGRARCRSQTANQANYADIFNARMSPRLWPLRRFRFVWPLDRHRWI